jgi:hypothetical protein
MTIKIFRSERNLILRNRMIMKRAVAMLNILRSISWSYLSYLNTKKIQVIPMVLRVVATEIRIKVED